jgi:chloramphenicol 3-O phosphotransferase
VDAGTGRVIVLNGASSSGKTSLARALQDRMPDTWLLLGIDTFITALPWRLYGTAEGHTINPDGTIDVGQEWHVARDRWRRAVGALVRDGADVILDEVFTEGADDQARWRDALDGLDVTWVAVRCAPDVAEARELARGDRSIGLARQQSATVHVGIDYDLEVDTTVLPPDVTAAQIHDRFVSGGAGGGEPGGGLEGDAIG